MRNRTVNITLDKKSITDGTIRISIQESDYLPSVDKKIKDYARKANIKGFRQGKVPSGVVKNMFGKSFMVDEINQLVSQSVTGYIRDNKLNVLGDPMPNEEKAAGIDWETQKDFDFEFRVGLAEDFKVELSEKLKVTRKVIEVTEQTVSEAVEDARLRYGNISYPEVSSITDTLYGEVAREGEEEMKPGYINIQKLSSNVQKQFTGVKKDDVITFEGSGFSEDAAETARALNISEAEAKVIKGTFKFKVTTISHSDPAEFNQDFFDKVFGKDKVTTEEAFRAMVRETIEKNYEREADHMFEHELEHFFTDQIKFSLPEEFLKDWLKKTDEKINDEVLSREFSSYTREMRWNLIREKIAELGGIKVEAADVREKAKVMIIEQFGGAAIADQLGDRMDAFADNYLQGNEGKNFMRLYNQLRNEKISAYIKEKITVSNKTVSLEEFRKYVSEHQHHH
ncbi:MAG: trigger factor [Cyclobacteriaceae bacterium]